MDTRSATREDDARLIAEYRAGRVESLEELVQRYRKPLFAFILRMAAGQEEADEVFQEVWIRAIRAMGSFDGRNLLSWLFRITHNLLIDKARQRGRTVSLDATGGGGEPGGDPFVDSVRARDPDPASAVAARDLAGRISALVNELPAEQREVFTMRAEADLPFREIARIQGVSINTALARMHYALAKLRAAVGRLEEERR